MIFIIMKWTNSSMCQQNKIYKYIFKKSNWLNCVILQYEINANLLQMSAGLVTNVLNHFVFTFHQRENQAGNGLRINCGPLCWYPQQLGTSICVLNHFFQPINLPATPHLAGNKHRVSFQEAAVAKSTAKSSANKWKKRPSQKKDVWNWSLSLVISLSIFNVVPNRSVATSLLLFDIFSVSLDEFWGKRMQHRPSHSPSPSLPHLLHSYQRTRTFEEIMPSACRCS